MPSRPRGRGSAWPNERFRDPATAGCRRAKRATVIDKLEREVREDVKHRVHLGSIALPGVGAFATRPTTPVSIPPPPAGFAPPPGYLPAPAPPPPAPE